ncbi:anhydro-N-acetylmuramic acid kinase [Fulvivirga lutimaris]|uniref:anhydro-N-acetylmuramic acid kinase n=1 Tax=Fulvivirga lutimaris TaxID=1819566 RepID=UPI0012BBE60D|nr:anhydro-N-acetylmuramic acid kinase [Fulvivirga lutimaris]MTI40354.1 anhydro-N-acetylmuramic acid kinase [Fulvivirga lutimaris]
MKKNDRYSVIGLMSGTSLDGLDIAHCHFSKAENGWSFEIERATTIPYTEQLQGLLKESTTLSGQKLAKLDIELGQWYGKVVNDFKRNSNFDFIASHGHTIFHQPEQRLTFQIGNGHIINVETGLPVVFDFRTIDVALGGQGAPLVPIGDKLLFKDYEGCLNLGGIANISFDTNDKRIAFDISPCNMPINYLMNTVEKSFDDKGELAKSGSVINDLLSELNSLPYYKDGHPKSLGYEWVDHNIHKKLNTDNYSLQDLLCTAVEHISIQIANVINSIPKQEVKVLVTGGGAKNEYMIERIINHLDSGKELIVPDYKIVDYKEALIFAFLGVLRVRNEVNCLSSVTGASKDSSAGIMVGF